jgi:DNA polymerase-3 subunit epsilon
MSTQIHRCLILDTETSGLEDNAPVIEIGAILYSVDSQCSLQELSTLLPAPENAAESINRIKTSALGEIALIRSTAPAMELLFAMSKSADVYVAHNADFDSKRIFGNTDILPLASLPWVCTMSDFKWPLATREQGSLINIALDHGIGVASARLFQALVPFERKDEAKAAGFKWNGSDKTWTRQMAIEDATALGFPVKLIEAA